MENQPRSARPQPHPSFAPSPAISAQAVKEHLLHGEGPQPRFRTVLLRLRTTDETELVGAMEAVAAAVGSDVAVGSYPVSGQSDAAGVVLSLESRVPSALEMARDVLGGHLPPGALLAEHLDVDVVSSPAPSPAAAAAGAR